MVFFYYLCIMNITNTLLQNIEYTGDDMINIDIEDNKLYICGEIKINDTRHWRSPSYDSCDGLPILISGYVDIEIDIKVFKNEEEIDFNLDENEIYKYFNNED